MKTYYILKLFTHLLPSIVYQTNNAADAAILAAVYERNDNKYKYIVVTTED